MPIGDERANLPDDRLEGASERRVEKQTAFVGKKNKLHDSTYIISTY